MTDPHALHYLLLSCQILRGSDPSTNEEAVQSRVNDLCYEKSTNLQLYESRLGILISNRFLLLDSGSFGSLDDYLQRSYLKLVFHAADVLNQFRNGVSKNMCWGGIGCCLDLEDKVVVQWMWHLVSCKQHFWVFQ